MNPATVDEPFVFSPTAPPAVGGVAVGMPNPSANYDPLVDETRREISEIVREVAAAVHRQLNRDEFLCMLVDRCIRAMAAEGVVVWQVKSPDVPATIGGSEQAGTAFDSSSVSLVAVARIGRITERSIASVSRAAHDRMLREVLHGGQPVVVPPTPDATDPQVPANPAAVPAAVVPIHCDPLSRHATYLLQAFLEPDCGVATQRGYLRFVAQMADLASEFLRNDQLRSMHLRQRLAGLVDRAIATLHCQTRTRKIETFVADSIAEIFGFDRVGLCYMRDGEGTLAAVSHSQTIDQQSDSAKQIVASAETYHVPQRCVVIESENDAPETTQCTRVTESSPMHPQLVVSADAASGVCIVALNVSDQSHDLSAMTPELQRITDHAGLAIRHYRAMESIPCGKWLVALSNRSYTPRSGRLLSRAISITLLTIALIVAFFPVRMVVNAPATLRPAEVQTVFAPRSAVVDKVHVKHAQQVRQGQLLITMNDPELEQQITSLLGRQAVLKQKQAAFITALVDTASHRMDRNAQLQSDRSLVDEELQSIDHQLQILAQIKQSLELRAMKDGIVDGWQIERRLEHRPVLRGESLLSIIPNQTDWLADARVPLSRVQSIRQALRSEKLVAAATIEGAYVGLSNLPAKIEQFGPTLRNPQDASESKLVAVRLTFTPQNIDDNDTQTDNDPLRRISTLGPLSGAPTRVMFRCESAPLMSVLFHDAIDSLRSTISLYLSTNSTSTEAL